MKNVIKNVSCFCPISCPRFRCEKNTPPSFERPPAPVSARSSDDADVPVYIDSVGKTVARRGGFIQPQVSGQITEIHFVDGANLRKGDMLFTIDPRPYRAHFESALRPRLRRRRLLWLWQKFSLTGTRTSWLRNPFHSSTMIRGRITTI